MSGALAGRGQAAELNKGRVEATKVRRYWPGKRPDWVAEDEEGEELEEEEQDVAEEPAPDGEPAVRTGIAAPVIVKRGWRSASAALVSYMPASLLRRVPHASPASLPSAGADDPRLRRLAEARPAGEGRHRQREVVEPQVGSPVWAGALPAS